MSNKFSWDDDGEFRDIPDEVNGEEGQVANFSIPEPVPPANSKFNQMAKKVQKVEPYEINDVYEELEHAGIIAEEDDEVEDYKNILSDARLRLEQGRLYEMLMNHDIFEGLNADAKAIKIVKSELKKFAKERMEIMLGMRQTTDAPQVTQVKVEAQFNELEVSLLKQLTYKMSQGKTAEPQANKIAEKIAPKKETLTPISNKVAAPAPAKPAPLVAKAAPPKAAPKPLASKPSAPIERPKRKPGRPPKNVDLLELDYKPLDKPIHEMTEEEIIERNKQAMERQSAKKSVRPKDVPPMPTVEQQEMLYIQRQAEISHKNPGISALVSLINSQKKQ